MMDGSPQRHTLTSPQFSPAPSPRTVAAPAAPLPEASEETSSEGQEQQEQQDVTEGQEELEEEVEGEEEEEQAEEAVEAQQSVQALSVLCPVPEVVELDSFGAQLVWGDPYYAPLDSEEEEDELPPLQIHRFEVDWVRVPGCACIAARERGVAKVPVHHPQVSMALPWFLVFALSCVRAQGKAWRSVAIWALPLACP